MKKLMITMGMLLAMLLVLTACGGNTDNQDTQGETQQTQVANPITEYESLTELEEAFGGTVANFGDNNTEGYEASNFQLIDGEDQVAEVIYTKGENEISVRTSNTEAGDISGVYLADDAEYQDYESNGCAVKYAMVEADTYVAYWVKDGNSYSIYETEEMEETFFKVLVDYLTE